MFGLTPEIRALNAIETRPGHALDDPFDFPKTERELAPMLFLRRLDERLMMTALGEQSRTCPR